MAKVKVNSRPVGRPAAIQQPMIDMAVEVGEWMINWMLKNGRVATGRSINSFEVTAIQNPQNVELTADDSVVWALQGRNAGEFPNVGAIKDWINDKNIRLRPDEKTGRMPTINQVAYLIGKKIADSGTNQPRLKNQNITFAIKQISRKHMKKLSDNLAEDIAESIALDFLKSNQRTKLK